MITLVFDKIRKVKRISPRTNFLVTLFGTVFFWKGAWDLLNKLFFPENLLLSGCLSLMIGLALLLAEDAKEEKQK